MNPSFAPILAVARLMQGFSGLWFVSGGWAIDLFLGNVTRGHADIEIGIYRRDHQALWRQFPNWSFEKAIKATEHGQWVRWEKDEELRQPIHQIRVKSPRANPSEIEFFLNERTDTHWVSRRHPGLARPLGEVTIISHLGIPILAPEIQLLFKAKQTRPKDQADFELTLSRLSPAQKDWLTNALHEHHPDHAWLKA